MGELRAAGTFADSPNVGALVSSRSFTGIWPRYTMGPRVTSNLLQIFDRTDDLVGKAVVNSLGCRHPVISVGVFADPLDRLSGLGGDDLARLDVDVRCWALLTAHWLMQQEARVRQAKAEPLLAGRIDERAGRGHPAGTDHVDRHVGTHKLDDVMDRVTRFDMTSGRIDIDLDRLRGFVDERQYPGHDVACQLVSDLAEHHDLAPFEQA